MHHMIQDLQADQIDQTLGSSPSATRLRHVQRLGQCEKLTKRMRLREKGERKSAGQAEITEPMESVMDAEGKPSGGHPVMSTPKLSYASQHSSNASSTEMPH